MIPLGPLLRNPADAAVERRLPGRRVEAVHARNLGAIELELTGRRAGV